MADAGTTPDVPVVIDGDVIVEFNEASSRQQINSGESVKTLFGKIRKFLTDLKAVAFSGAYSDLSGVPDLSEYVKTVDVPNIKVNEAVDADYATNAGNANTVDGLHADDFVNATDKGQIQTPSNVDVPVWIHANGKRFQRYMTNAGNTGLTNVPDNSIDYVWYWYDGLNILARENSSGKYYICDTINGVFSGWKDIYTSGYKPYVTGTLSEQANDSTVTLGFTIFDFTPSKVICQFGSGNAFFANVVTNGFSLTIPAGTTTIHYIAFK